MTATAHQEAPGRDYRKERDAAYTERNRVVAALARLVVAMGGSAWLAPHPEDPEWDPEWKTIVFIEMRIGQMSWHLHDSDVPLFDGLPRGLNKWDGHTTEQKYARLAQLWRPDGRSGKAAEDDFWKRMGVTPDPAVATREKPLLPANSEGKGAYHDALNKRNGGIS